MKIAKYFLWICLNGMFLSTIAFTLRANTKAMMQIDIKVHVKIKDLMRRVKGA
jgi:hypothetical protein